MWTYDGYPDYIKTTFQPHCFVGNQRNYGCGDPRDGMGMWQQVSSTHASFLEFLDLWKLENFQIDLRSPKSIETQLKSFCCLLNSYELVPCKTLVLLDCCFESRHLSVGKSYWWVALGRIVACLSWHKSYLMVEWLYEELSGHTRHYHWFYDWTSAQQWLIVGCQLDMWLSALLGSDGCKARIQIDLGNANSWWGMIIDFPTLLHMAGYPSSSTGDTSMYLKSIPTYMKMVDLPLPDLFPWE